MRPANSPAAVMFIDCAGEGEDQSAGVVVVANDGGSPVVVAVIRDDDIIKAWPYPPQRLAVLRPRPPQRLLPVLAGHGGRTDGTVALRSQVVLCRPTRRILEYHGAAVVRSSEVAFIGPSWWPDYPAGEPFPGPMVRVYVENFTHDDETLGGDIAFHAAHDRAERREAWSAWG